MQLLYAGAGLVLVWAFMRRSAGGTLPGAEPGLGTSTIPPGAPAPVLQWRDLAVRYGQRVGVSPQLVLAVIWQESTGNENARGSVGEVGLMQLTEDACIDVGIGWPPWSPAANVLAGASYLKLQIDRMGGDIYDGLRAYNAGEGGARAHPANGRTYAREVLQKAGWT